MYQCKQELQRMNIIQLTVKKKAKIMREITRQLN